MSGCAVALSGIRRTFKSGFSLDVPSLQIAAGERVAVLGPSGSGKTSLLEVLGLLERPEHGRILLDGAEVSASDRAARLRTAAVFQRPYLFKGTVEANVGYGLVCRGVPKSERAPRIGAALERVGLLGYEGRSALTLSGGEAQRVSLARALAVEPDVLLVDEPLASLDPLLKRRLTQEFTDILRDAGVTVVWVTHDQDEALVVADRLIIMREGGIIADGPADEVAGLPPDAWTAAFLGVEEAQAGTVVSNAEGLAVIAVGDQMVYGVSPEPPGTRVMFAIRPEDVVLFEHDAVIPMTTARNHLAARVTSCDARGATNRVLLDAHGVRLAATVSRAAMRELGIAPGVEVTALFKASAVRVRIADAQTSNNAPRQALTTGKGRTS